jgi:biotin carboxyl carrier protein
VAVDDVIVILESMKMEIPIQASKAGNVLEIMVAEEDMVAEGQHIATIESA